MPSSGDSEGPMRGWERVPVPVPVLEDLRAVREDLRGWERAVLEDLRGWVWVRERGRAGTPDDRPVVSGRVQGDPQVKSYVVLSGRLRRLRSRRPRSEPPQSQSQSLSDPEQPQPSSPRSPTT